MKLWMKPELRTERLLRIFPFLFVLFFSSAHHLAAQGKIEKLELELQESIKEQNFERSIELRDELKKLRS
jgi:excinuclease UvrABC helicase subunit UvrB